MSILIKGMEMPKCHFKTGESYNVHGFWMVYPDGKSKLHIMVDSDHWVCEAIPVPPHGRLIDADALRAEVKKHATPSDAWVFSLIRTAPTIIPAEEE